MKQKHTLKKIGRGFRELHRLEPKMLPLIAFSALSKALFPFINLYFSSRIIDVLSEKGETRTFALLVSIALCSNFLLFVLSKTLETRLQLTQNMLYNKERSNVMRTLYGMDYEKLEDAEFQNLVHRHQESMDRAGAPLTCLSWVFHNWINGGATLALALVLMFPLLRISFQGGSTFIESPWFAVVLFAAIGVCVGVILLISQKLNKQWFALNEEYMGINRVFHFYRELLTDYKTGKEIRTYQEQELIEKDATEQLLGRGFDIQNRIAKNSAGTSSLIAIIGALLGFGIYTFIGLKGLIGLFTIGSLVKYTGSFMQVIGGVTAIATTAGQLPQVLPTLDYYFDIIHTKSSKKKGSLLPEPGKLEIEFCNVSFRYPGAKTYALRHFSMKLQNGEHLAVVGRNGSGKTTFIKLLCRLYDPEEGEIRLNGIDIREYEEQAYQKLFSVVFQDFAIFSFTLGQNVAAGETYDSGRATACLKEADMGERAGSLPHGLDTYLYKDLEEEGVELSGGEGQKLALARALYKDAPIIVLDEPTAALDPIAEYKVYEKFNGFVEHKTAVYISHRLSSCRFCRKIAVFQKGTLAQFGSHEELIQNENGAYFELWNAQAQYYT